MRSVVISLALVSCLVSSELLPSEDATSKLKPRISAQLKALEERANKPKDDPPWVIQETCHAELIVPINETNYHCSHPRPGDSCFGVPIDYPHVPSRQALPAEYEVLRRFPKCWTELAPLLCAVAFRPCAVYPTKTLNNSTIQYDQREYWQRFEVADCWRVLSQCEDAIKERIFPSELINCTRSAGKNSWREEENNSNGALARFGPYRYKKQLKAEWERQTFFTEEKCNVRYEKENAPQLEPMQCIFPLVYAEHSFIRPVIDDCFLPCRNPLISSPDQFIVFRIVRTLLCFAIAAVCFAIFVYLAYWSPIYVSSDAIFSIACCLLCFFVYLLCWGAGSFPYIAEASECTHTDPNGVAIRDTQHDSIWCILNSLVKHISLLSSIGFIAVAYALSVAAASKADEDQEAIESDPSCSCSGIRFFILAGVVIVSSSFGIIAYLLKMMSTDGMAGLCSVGLHSILDHLSVIAAPGLIYCLIALGWGARKTWEEKKRQEAEIEEKIQEAIRQEKRNLKNSRKRGTNREERDGEDEILVLSEDEEELRDGKKREIRKRVVNELKAEWLDRELRISHRGISSSQTLVALCICIYSLIFGLFVHYITLANDGREETETLLKYVRCVMTQSIMGKDLHWLHKTAHAEENWANGTAVADPFERRLRLASDINILKCEYPSTTDGRRMFGLLFVFIVLPMLPIVVFIWSFVAGYRGVGGMAMVKKRESNRSAFEEEEMIGLNQMHVEEEKRDEIADRVDEDEAFTVSTAQSLLARATTSKNPPLSDAERTMIRNMETFITSSLNEADERGIEWPQRLQLVQEELVLRTLPRDEASGSGIDNQQQQQQQQNAIFVEVLEAARSSLLTPFVQDPEYGEIANQGMTLSGQTIALARLAHANCTLNFRSINYFVLQLAINRIHQLAYHLLRRVAPTAELIADIQTAIRATNSQIQLNGMMNADQLLYSQQSLAQQNFDVNDDEGVQERIQLYVGAYNEQPPEILAQLLDDIVSERNRRYASLLMERQRERRIATAASALEQHQRMQLQHVDQRPLIDGMGARPEANSTDPETDASASPMTLLEMQEGYLEHNRETLRRQLEHAGPSTMDEANAASTTGVPEYIANVMRANGRSIPVEFDRQTGHATAPITRSRTLPTVPPARHYVESVEPLVEIQQSASGEGSAAEEQQEETNIPRHFPWLGDNDAPLPAVPTFPGARPTGRQFLTLQEQQDRAAAAAAVSASSTASIEPTSHGTTLSRQRDAAATSESASTSATVKPKIPQKASQQLNLPDAPNEKLERRQENRKKRKAEAVALEVEGWAAKRSSSDEDGSPSPLASTNDDSMDGSIESPSSNLPENFEMLGISGERNAGTPKEDEEARDEMMKEEMEEEEGREEEEGSSNEEERMQVMSESDSNADQAMSEGEEEEKEEEENEDGKEKEENNEKEEGKKEEEEENEKEKEEVEDEVEEDENTMEEEEDQDDEQTKKDGVATIVEARDEQQKERDAAVAVDEGVETGGSQSDVSITSQLPSDTVIRPTEAELPLESV